MKYDRFRGKVSNIIRVFIPDNTSTTGAGLTGLTNASTNLTISYMREFDSAATAYSGANIETITTIGTFQAPSTSSKCRFKAVDATNFPGVYEIHFHDSATIFGTGDASVNVQINVYEASTTALKIGPNMSEIRLIAWDMQTSLSATTIGTLTTNSDKAGYSLTQAFPANFSALSIDSGGVAKSNLAQILGTALTETAGQIAAAFVKFFNKSAPTGTVNSLPDAVAGAASGLALVGSNVGQATSVSGAVGSVTGAVGSVTGNVGGNVSGNVSGSVGSVTGAVGSVTGAVGSVTGNVGGSAASVAGAVGSVSGNVGGDVAGKVLGGGGSSISGDGVRASSVTGAVGSVTGAVGSVTGAVTLNLAQALSVSPSAGTLGQALSAALGDAIGKIVYAPPASNPGTGSITVYASDGTTVLKTSTVTTDSSGNVLSRV